MIRLVLLLFQTLPAMGGEPDLSGFHESDELEDAAIRSAGQAVVAFGVGTGFLVSDDGQILTNAHVAEAFGDRGAVQVAWTDEPVAATLLKRWPDVDAALYTIGGSGRPHLTFRDRPAALDEPITLLGHPGHGVQRAAFGYVREYSSDPRMLFHDAPTAIGMSGAPVLDASGQVIALHRAFIARDGAQSVAVPAAVLAPEARGDSRPGEPKPPPR